MTQAFELTGHDLGAAKLRPLTSSNAEKLGAALVTMPPWSVIGLPPERMTRSLTRELPSVRRFEVIASGTLAGVIAIQDPFLAGPYLQLLAILPEFQRQNLGLRLLQWMEAEARLAENRQLWLCVSTFNSRAREFYERSGFEAISVLEKLISDASDEMFMRKRLSYGAPAEASGGLKADLGTQSVL